MTAYDICCNMLMLVLWSRVYLSLTISPTKWKLASWAKPCLPLSPSVYLFLSSTLLALSVSTETGKTRSFCLSKSSRKCNLCKLAWKGTVGSIHLPAWALTHSCSVSVCVWRGECLVFDSKNCLLGLPADIFRVCAILPIWVENVWHSISNPTHCLFSVLYL